MSGPWEKYAAPTQAPAAGPWTRYAAPAPAVPPGTDAATGLPMAVAPPSLDAPADPVVPDETGQFDEILRGLQVGAQGAGRGLADLAGLPGDLSTAAVNFPLAAADMAGDFLLGENSPEFLDFRFPPSPVGSDSIANVSSEVARALGMDVLDYEDMAPEERRAYNVNRFGTQAAVTAGGLTSAAARSGASTRATPRMRDAFTYPYTTPNAGRALVGDTMGGAGAGLGFSAVEEASPFDDPVLQAIAEVGGIMAGGVAGNLAGATVSSPGAVTRAIQSTRVDPSIPLPQTGPPVGTTRGAADNAARVLQEQAANLPQAQANLETNLRTSRQAGSAVPTPGSLTEDPGLLALEQGFRTRGSALEPNMPSRFQGRDEAVRDSAAERITGLADPNADQAGALDYIRARPQQLKEERDAAALPLLRQAEASGAVIDASPVAGILDEAMAKTKRPEVIKALTAARNALNGGGAADGSLDTSLTGLYETRKVIQDLIDGRSESNTGRFAQSELIEAKQALDKILTDAVPEFGQYLDEFRAGSRPLDVFDERLGQRLLGEETDLRNVARQILSPSKYGTEDLMAQVNQMVAADPAAAAGWKAAVSDVLIDKVRTTSDDISYSNLRRVYEQNREALGQIYTPEEMGRLEEAQTLLRLVNQNRGGARGASVAPGTDPRAAVEASLFGMGYNAVTIGMIMKRINVASNFLGLEKHTTAFKTSRLLERAAFDPELYDLLIKRPVTEEPGPLWNDQVRKNLSRGQVVREFAGEEEPSEDDEMMNAIGAPEVRPPADPMSPENLRRFGGP